MRLLLDANLLVLYIVGVASPDYVAKHRRLSAFVLQDFETLAGLVEQATQVLVTPHILAEASNLAGYIRSPARGRVMDTLAMAIGGAVEEYVPSKKAASRDEFRRLGLADAVLLELADAGITIVTVDFDLCVAAASAGATPLNFNHMRDSYLG